MSVSQRVNTVLLQRLRIVGHVEAISTLLLFFVAMPLKYLYGMPEAVRLVGSLHGFLFLLYLSFLFYGVKRIPLSQSLAGVCAFASIVPFGPFVIDPRLKRLAERA